MNPSHFDRVDYAVHVRLTVLSAAMQDQTMTHIVNSSNNKSSECAKAGSEHLVDVREQWPCKLLLHTAELQ